MSSPPSGGYNVNYGGPQWYVKTASEMGLHKKEPLFLALWGAWLLTGTLFYSYAPDFELGFVKGFYMAINIGYSIGFGYPIDKNTPSIWFGIFYVLIGSSFVGVALGFFAEKITEDSETWFSRLQDQKKIEDFILLGKKSWRGRIHAWFYKHRSAIRAVLVWVALVIILLVISLYGIGWSFKEALYFAISTLSTGGHWMIPIDSPLWLYGVTAFLTAIGVPMMALAMAAIGTSMMDQGDLEEAKSAINDPVTKEEFQMLEDLGLEDGDGELDLAEFILLCMVRVGTDPGLLSYIRQRFQELSEGETNLTVEQLTERNFVYKDGRLRNFNSVNSEQPPEGLPLVDEEEEDQDETSSIGSDKETAPEHGVEVQDAKQDESNDGNNNTNATRTPDEEEGHQDWADEDNAEGKDDLLAVQMGPVHFETHQLTDKRVLQPQCLQEVARPLGTSDDFGMALLDRDHVMSMEEERALLMDARQRMKTVLEISRSEEGWSSRGKIAGVKISSKAGMHGTPLNMIRGEAEMPDNFSLEFACSQLRYDMRTGEAFDGFYRELDPMCIQTTVVTKIRNKELLDTSAFEDLVVLWIGIRSPIGLVNDRDFCLVFHLLMTKCPVTGDAVASTNFFSIVHPAVPDMERSLDRIRGDIKMGGYVMRPSRRDKKRHTVQFLVEYDPKGALPVKVVNAISLSQGLNAGRFRESYISLVKKAAELNNATTPVGWYNLSRGGKTQHRLQLVFSGDDFPVNASTVRTFKFELVVMAAFTVIMKVSTKDASGMPLPVSLHRSERSDQMGKLLAAGNSVAFGWKGYHRFSTTLLMTVEGPIPKALTLRFRNSLWRTNRIHVPAIVVLTQTDTPDPSVNSAGSVSGPAVVPAFHRTFTPTEREV